MPDSTKLEIVLLDEGGPAGPRTETAPSPSARQQLAEAGGGSRAGAAAEGEAAGDAAAEEAGAAEGAEAAGAAGELALGPAGIALLAVSASAKAIAGQFDNVGAAAKAVGSALTSLAANDNLAALTKTADAAAGALGKIPIVGQVAESAIKAITSTFTAANAVVDAFVERGRQLSQFSPELAAAGAQAEITSILADIKEAQELGPELAQLTTAQAELSAQLRELLLPIKLVVVEALAGVLKLIEDFLPYLRASFDALKAGAADLLQVFKDALAREFQKAIGDLGKIIPDMKKAFKDALDEHQKDKEQGNLFEQQMAALFAGAGLRPPVGLAPRLPDPVGGAVPPLIPFGFGAP
jgi:hypothetical protein